MEILIFVIYYTVRMRHGKYDLPLDNSDSTFSTGQSAMSASRSSLPVRCFARQMMHQQGSKLPWTESPQNSPERKRILPLHLVVAT